MIDDRFVVILEASTFGKLDSQVYPKRYVFDNLDDVIGNHRALLPHTFTKAEALATVVRCLTHHPEYTQALMLLAHCYQLDRNKIITVLRQTNETNPD